MGCISSKVISRSLSLRDELNQRHKRFGSKNRNDPFVALIFPPNNPSNQSTTLDPIPNNAGYDADVKEPIAEEIVLSMLPRLSLEDLEALRVVDPPKRSKSWHQLPVGDESSSSSAEWKNAGVTRSRSFHTVEEFDELLERIRLESLVSLRKDDDEEEDEYVPKQRAMNAVEEAKEASRSVDTELSTVLDGLKRRRSLGRRLESLKVPNLVEFPAVGSLREWLQVYPPGNYATPKFGSYSVSSNNSRLADQEDESLSREGYAFIPDLVTDIEKHMEQLQVEEESILKQIAEDYLNESGGEEDRVEEGPRDEIPKLGMD